MEHMFGGNVTAWMQVTNDKRGNRFFLCQKESGHIYLTWGANSIVLDKRQCESFSLPNVGGFDSVAYNRAYSGDEGEISSNLDICGYPLTKEDEGED